MNFFGKNKREKKVLPKLPKIQVIMRKNKNESGGNKIGSVKKH
jgi:hypothetical protein